MFGYIKIDKDELLVKDYNVFKAHYCGLCQTLKKEYGFPARYFLSYDVTFLALLFMSLSDDEPVFCPHRCLANPMIKRPVAEKNEAFSYAGAVNVLLAYFKLKDDWQDNRSVKALLLMPLLKGKKKKASRQYPQTAEHIETALAKLSQLEKEKCPEADKMAALFGDLMAGIFDSPLAGNEEARRITRHCGFLLGRFIYLLDAWADREEDQKKEAYNPFNLGETQDAELVHTGLTYTLSQLANSFSLLSFTKNERIINNIIYLGLKNAADSVFAGKNCCKQKENNHEKPL